MLCEGNVDWAIRMPSGQLQDIGQWRRRADRRTCRVSGSALWRPQPCSLERGELACRNAVDREFLDRLVEEPIKIELGGEMQEHPAEPDGGAVHEDEFARHPHRPFFLAC